MSDIANKIAAGFAAVALITAFGLHAKQLALLPKPTGQAVSGVFHTAETGQA